MESVARSPWTPLHAQVHQVLRSRKLLTSNQSLLLAVSGGQDSLCLAKLFLDLQPKWGWNLAIGHCDHGWRSDSAANADHVESLALSWGLPCYRRTCSPSEQGSRSEAAARQWRYAALIEMAQVGGYGTIVTGHTASDRAETLLYNLVRGSGSDGLQALTWRRHLTPEVTLVRPLLALSRSETAAFCQTFHLPVWEDATNMDRSYARNRIRQDLIPYLQEHLNPQAEKLLAQTAELLQAEVAYLEAEATQLRQQVQPLDRAALHRLPLGEAPLALQRRVVRQFLEQQLPCSPTFEQIEKLVALISAPNRSCTDPLPGGSIAQVEGDWICLRSPQ
ncbi:tRNA lysidine(34) synthetase TilS [Leptolyngbya sp. 'hensonii']|uniref:tRNA lysidine(34) synthetase TilS n=1 Tax=Leptolyngbya sp. 'hensonii' TaxID=1922337 RepID=UPI0009501410|nr:tRNA lysidine(34) synthetase TilS [Leptolyngbya sp. 'hensonii']OLP19356.1 tRNA lysidine(34) synthetase TilS [Leptolyngbya sp. 'hensonii']